MITKNDKPAAVQTLFAIYDIAEGLYHRDSARFKPIYGWVGAMVKQRKDLHLVLQAMQRLAARELGRIFGEHEPRATSHEPRPVLDVVQYLGGTLRGLEQERDAAKARRGEPTGVGEILAECFKRIKQ